MGQTARFKENAKVAIPITESLAKKVKKLVLAGLVEGVGVPQPGEMCVEAAVCYAIGQEHGDKPICVDEGLRNAKIVLNDDFQGSDLQRGKTLRRVAIAQLGTKEINQQKLRRAISEELKAWAQRQWEKQTKNLLLTVKGPEDLVIVADNIANLQDTFGDTAFAFPKEVHPEEAYGQIDTFCEQQGFETDEIIFITAEILTRALIKVKSPGSKFLSLVPLTKDEKKHYGF